jgi:hypothetical protein
MSTQHGEWISGAVRAEGSTQVHVDDSGKLNFSSKSHDEEWHTWGLSGCLVWLDPGVLVEVYDMSGTAQNIETADATLK